MSSAVAHTGDVHLRAADESDLENTLAWQREPGTRQYFRQPNPPTRAKHEAWFRKRLSRPEPALWIVEVAGQPVGTVRLDARGGPDCARYEVSILIASAYRGKGIGVKALNCLRLAHPNANLVATISPENKASIATFIRAGFRQIAPEYYEARPLSGGNAADYTRTGDEDDN